MLRPLPTWLLCSQFVLPFSLPWMVHPKEGGRKSAHISLSFHKGRKRRHAVANEVVGSTQHVQVHLCRVGPKTHHPYLRGQSHTQIHSVTVIRNKFILTLWTWKESQVQIDNKKTCGLKTKIQWLFTTLRSQGPYTLGTRRCGVNMQTIHQQNFSIHSKHKVNVRPKDTQQMKFREFAWHRSTTRIRWK